MSLSAQELLDIYLRRIQLIDKGLDLNAIIQLNPDARHMPPQLDQERRQHGPRGPLHGIPILLKDNIDTGDRQRTTAGSLALAAARASGCDCHEASARCRRGGSSAKRILQRVGELPSAIRAPAAGAASAASAAIRTFLDRNPVASSSGSGAATAAALTSAALATETDGSIVCPAGQCGVAGIKPTVG
jgi:amidase